MKQQNLKKLIIKIFTKHSLSRKDSEICAEALLNAELVGAYGH